jgi:uncharacterized OB-fold protein
MTVPGQQDESGRYLPMIYPEERPYWEAAARHELVLPKCDACSKVYYPVGPVCPNCLSDSFSWVPMSGHGKVSSFVVYHKAWAPWMKSLVPYVVAQVELDEGPRLTTNLLGIELADVSVGLEVRVDFQQLTEEISLPQFRPVEVPKAS